VRSPHIGTDLGSTRTQTLSVLRRLHEEGLATVRRGMVQIHDVVGLHRLAQPVFDIFERSHPEFGSQQTPPTLAN